MKNWYGHGWRWSLPVLRHYPGNCMEGVVKLLKASDSIVSMKTDK
jgi:hypothetical protein